MRCAVYIRKTKNSTIDSMIIAADVIRFPAATAKLMQPGDLQAMQELCRQRFYVIDMASDLKRKVLALLDQVFPEYENSLDTFGASSMELLSQYATPRRMLSVGAACRASWDLSRGRLGLAKAEKLRQRRIRWHCSCFGSFALIIGSISNKSTFFGILDRCL